LDVKQFNMDSLAGGAAPVPVNRFGIPEAKHG
jgi:hypothetical protein